MATFVALAALMSLGAIAIVLLGARSRLESASRAQVNIDLLRQQLQELDGERAALAVEAYQALRDELQRRLLADAQCAAPAAAPRGARRPVLAAAALVPALAAALYAALGSPGAIERDGSTLSGAQLEAQVAAVPADARAWVLLARLRMDADQFGAAADAYGKAIAASPRKVARDPQVWAEYADALGMYQGGTLAGRPRAAIERALALDPRHPQALELAGSAAVEGRDFRAAHMHWSALLAQLPADSPQRGPLAAALAKVERLAKFALPAS